mgnify:CR=1 FL=1
MISRLLLASLFVICLANTVNADQFQFVHSATGALIANARVEVNDSLYGYTDLYGRISISLTPGTYSFTVVFMGQRLSRSLTITGSTELKVERF